MFFVIGGIQPKTIVVDRQAGSCPACGQPEVYRKRVDHYLSLFFIPLFPVKRGAPFLSCKNCKTIFDEGGYRMGVGQGASQPRCPSCGRQVGFDFAFCPFCGNAI